MNYKRLLPSSKSIIICLVQVVVALVILSLPLLFRIVQTGEVGDLRVLFFTNFWFGPFIMFYFINFYLLVPFVFYRSKIAYIIINTLLLAFFNAPSVLFDPIFIPVESRMGYTTFVAGMVLLDLFGIVTALGIRHLMRKNKIEMQLREEQQKNAEAELAWLKNQLNPHFLFNTLNNISSLVQIDADMAQDSIGKLSDLLRYALYETRKEHVQLRAELEFIGNYIDLMKMRCGSSTSVTFSSNVSNPDVMIAPLLFLSPIENAFKHGVSNTSDSTINIELTQKDKVITFSCRNTNLAKGSSDHSGSGIGYENMRRRLELIYPGKHKLSQTIIDNEYCLNIEIYG